MESFEKESAPETPFELNLDVGTIVQLSKDELQYHIDQGTKILKDIKFKIDNNKKEVKQLSDELVSQLNQSEDINDESLDACKNIADKLGSLEAYLKRNVTKFTLVHESLSAKISMFQQLEKIKDSKNNVLLQEWCKNYSTYLILDYLLQKNVITVESPLIKKLSHLSTFNFNEIFNEDIFTEFNQISNSILKDHDLNPLFEYLKHLEDSPNEQNKADDLEFQAHAVKFIQLFEDKKSREESFEYFDKNLFDRCSEEENKLYVGWSLPKNNIKEQKSSTISNLFAAPTFGNSFQTPKYESSIKAKFFFSAEKMTNLLETQSLFNTNSPYEELNSIFAKHYFQEINYSQTPSLLVYFILGASALHSKSCHQHEELSHQQNNLKNVGTLQVNQLVSQFLEKNYLSATTCPLCDLNLDWIKKKIPYSGITASYQIFDNDTVKFPQGNVYDKEELLSLNEELKNFLFEKNIDFFDKELLGTSILIDPASSIAYDAEDLKKLYPL